MRILEMKKQKPHHEMICQEVDPMCILDAVQKSIDYDIVHDHIGHDTPKPKHNEYQYSEDAIPSVHTYLFFWRGNIL